MVKAFNVQVTRKFVTDQSTIYHMPRIETATSVSMFLSFYQLKSVVIVVGTNMFRPHNIMMAASSMPPPLVIGTGTPPHKH